MTRSNAREIALHLIYAQQCSGHQRPAPRGKADDTQHKSCAHLAHRPAKALAQGLKRPPLAQAHAHAQRPLPASAHIPQHHALLRRRAQQLFKVQALDFKRHAHGTAPCPGVFA